MRTSVRVQGIAIALLFLLACAVWYAISRESRDGTLTVSFFSAGKGGVVFIDAPSGRQVLIGGGSDGAALRRLGSLMPPWDRSIDTIIAPSTNENDVAGLIDILGRYRVGLILQPSMESSAASWNLFEKGAAESGARILTARRGQVLNLGADAYLEILFPDRNMLDAGVGEGCVVSRLTYGATTFMLSCDASTGVERYLAMLDGTKLHSDALISNASSTPLFLGFVAPTLTVGACKEAPCATTLVSDGKTVFRR